MKQRVFLMLLILSLCVCGQAFAITPQEANSNMVECIMNDNAKGVKRMLSMGADVNFTDSKGSTPLHHAVLSGSNEVVQLLLENGANVNVAEYINGDTPLTLAAAKDNIEAYEMLVKAGADVNVKNDKNQTVLMIARANRSKKILYDLGDINYKKTEYPPYMTHKELDAELLKVHNPADLKELLKRGANANAKSETGGMSLLHSMSVISWSGFWYADRDVMTYFLIKGGANVNALDSRNHTPLYYFLKQSPSDEADAMRQEEYRNMKEYLIKAGALAQ
jgi:ankyrin repeat protein